MNKRYVKEIDIEGLTYINSAGYRVSVSPSGVESYRVRKDGVVIVKFYGYFWRERYSAWNGSVYRVRWGVKKPGGKWFVDERRKDALSQMENWSETHKRDRSLCKCEKEEI